MGDGNLYLYNNCQEILKFIKGNLNKVLPELWATHSVILKFFYLKYIIFMDKSTNQRVGLMNIHGVNISVQHSKIRIASSPVCSLINFLIDFFFERNLIVVPLIYTVSGCFLYVP